jgi:pimeloyl-ACP methyl ester carboxylesterase
MTGVMCKIGTLDIPRRGTIHYRIFRPNQLKEGNKPPLVVLHGGPMIPCNYLLPLAYVIVDRSIIFYDQLGCGNSKTVVSQDVLTTSTKDEPSEDQKSSRILDLPAMVQDLFLLLQHWDFPKYHLIGHSFGGILAFEYLKYLQSQTSQSKKDGKCLSVVLASAPTSVEVVEKEVQRLCQGLDVDEEDMEDEQETENVSTLPKTVPKQFRVTYECRLDPIPFPLADSYSGAGPKHLRGLPAIGNYEAKSAEPVENDAAVLPSLPPALVLRGQHDFCTEQCVTGWDHLFRDKQYMTLAGCSHYGMLENEGMYGSVISSFLKDCDTEES